MNEALKQGGIIFQLSEDGAKLLAVFEPSGEKAALDQSVIKQALIEQGLSALFIDDKALDLLIKQYNSATEGFSLEIGERRNGGCAVKIAADHMTAWLTLTPPFGGTPVTREQIDQTLKESGIVSGILVDEIEASLVAGSVNERIIAQGKVPVPGLDSQFQSLVSEIKERHPHVDEHGIADYRDLGQIIIVNPGDPLMRHIPPTPGENGQDIMGLVLYPKPGQDTLFASGLQGAELDPGDNNMLRATITGQPILVPQGVIVEPTLTLPQVDLSTGNITFDGTVKVTGDVKEGMKIHATGDVFVEGTVEAAEIQAVGNIVITCGVIGHGKYTIAPDPSQMHSAKIQCAGSLNVRFIENALVMAGADICIEEFSMHSDLTADNQIIVGKAGSKKGHLIGGIARATLLVKAAVFGSDAGIKTKVQVGFNPYLHEQLISVMHKIEVKEKEQTDIEKIIVYVRSHPEKNKDGLLDKAHHTLDKLLSEIALLHEEQTRIQTEQGLVEQAQIIAEQAIHGGTEIQIGNKIWKTNSERGNGLFQLKEGEIDFGSILRDDASDKPDS